MKTSLYLTDVVVLRNEVDTVSVWGLVITNTSRVFEARNSTEPLESLLCSYGLENSKPTANPGRRSAVMELASGIHLQGHDYSPSHSGWEPHLHGTMESRHASRHSTAVQHKCLILQQKTNAQRNSCLGISKVHTTPVFDPNHTCELKKEWLNLLESLQRAKVLHTMIALTRSHVTYQEPETDGHQCQFLWSRVLRSQCLRRRTCGLAELFKELHYKVSVRLEMNSDSARHTHQRKRTREHNVIRC